MRGTEEFRNRTKAFAAGCIRLYVGLDRNRYEVQVIGKQLIRSGTSVAANYREACRGRSTGDFVSKLNICIQEADETSLWLELLREECKVKSDLSLVLEKECNELIAIMVTMSARSSSSK